MNIDELMRNKGRGEALRIIAESVYFDAASITYVLADFLEKKFNENILFLYHERGRSEYYTIEKKGIEYIEIFSTELYDRFNVYGENLLAFEHMLSELGEQLFSNSKLWIVNRNLKGKIIQHVSVFDEENKYPEAKDFINYLFELQIQNNGKHLTYEEMQKAMYDFLGKELQKAMNDFLELERNKPKQKIKEKDKES